MDLNKFVCKSITSTPGMVVDVINDRGSTVYSYETPPDFQLDKYVQALFPNAELMVSGNYTDLTVSVIIPGTKDIYQIHRGIYKLQNH